MATCKEVNQLYCEIDGDYIVLHNLKEGFIKTVYLVSRTPTDTEILNIIAMISRLFSWIEAGHIEQLIKNLRH
ncbi:hypothetical protein I3263_17230 [Photobacterium damselae]|nr:hypothetical protein BST98_22065 [Photobacterium damselae]MCG3826275.1 hypothetical protein [Photobacterium damselae]